MALPNLTREQAVERAALVPVANYRIVLDLTDGRAALATAIMAGLGADVIKVEPPGGAASRHEGRLVDGEPEQLASLRFHAFNRGKRSVVLDLDDDADRGRFRDLVATADFQVTPSESRIAGETLSSWPLSIVISRRVSVYLKLKDCHSSRRKPVRSAPP